MTATNTLLKKTAQSALKSEYGFFPKLGDITLLEAHGDRTYILFSVFGHQYSFRSYDMGHGVWVGSGTVTKES